MAGVNSLVDGVSLEARNLAKRIGAHPAVDDVSLHVVDGTVLCITGASGAGKSTLLATLAGVVAPDTGSVLVCGIDANLSPSKTKRLLGYVPPSARVDDMTPLREQLMSRASCHGVARRSRAETVDGLLELLDLDRHARVPIGALPAAVAQRASLAGCLVHDPPVLILDDPFSCQETDTAKELAAIIGELAGMGKAVLMALGRIDHAMRIGTHHAVLDRGRLARFEALTDDTETPPNERVDP